MILVLLIVIPCCLVGLLVYAAMSKWELSSGMSVGSPYRGGTPRPHMPHLTLRETVIDWPVPQFQRLHPGLLIAISSVAALWIVAWIVLFFVGLSMLHA